MPRRYRPHHAIPLIIIGVVLLSLLLLVDTAGAHGSLVRSTPEANAMLERAPVQIELFFSEPIVDGFSTVEVLNAAGERVDNDDAGVDPTDTTRLSATVRSLPDGVYTVSWRVLSAVDSHITAGVYPFAVGDVDAAALESAAQAGSSITLSPGEALARWLTYAGMLTATGGMLFILMVWEPVVKAAGIAGVVSPPWRRIAKVALLTFVAGALLWLFVQAGQIAGKEVAFPWESSFVQTLFTTRFGALIIARLGLALLMLRLLLRDPGRRQRWIALALGALALLTISLGSHAAAEPNPLLPLLSDWVHLLVASFWLGGLVHFAAGMLATRPLEPGARREVTARLIPRFSALALISVALLLLTGTYASVIHVGSLNALATSIFGRALLLKLTIFAAMFILGAVNLLYTSPNMKQTAANEERPWLVTLFQRIVASEATLGMAVLLSVGLLTALPTPTDLAVAGSLIETQQADDLEITLEITPGRVGINTFLVTVTREGEPLDGARSVELQFTPVTSGLPPSEAQLTALGSGEYSVEGSFLSLPDAYQVQAVVRRADAFDAFANFDFNIGTTAVSAPQFPWHQLSGILFILLSLVFLYALWPFAGSRASQLILLGAPALALLLGGVYVFGNNPAPQQDNYLVNPIPPNADSVAIGEALYVQNCLPCHGATGLGDGPVGLTLNPPPADLTVHTAPGVHPDGRLYDWITNGFENSVMPAFRSQLTDEERWHLVNYIRTFSPESQSNPE